LALRARVGKAAARKRICIICDPAFAGGFRALSYKFPPPAIFWVDIKELKLEPGSAPAKLDLSERPIRSGEVSDKFVPAEPFKFLSY
jgi:hypothetical protein